MRSLNIDELKIIQLEILNCVADFCERNDIKYWLDFGTLIGAVRHNGYIPWDDDIDIGMLRPDYDRFLRLFNQSNERFKAYSIENNDQFLYAFCKIVDTHTIMYEPDEKGLKSNVYIDLFVFDNVPDEKSATKLYRRRDLFRFLHNTRTRANLSESKKALHICKNILRPFLFVFPKNYFCKKIVHNSKTYADKDCKYIGNFTACSKIFVEKSIFDEFIEVPFEGKTYKAPKRYDEWLRAIYGDYMQLPPEDQRVPHHRFKAYMLEEYDEKI